ncbi:MAG: FecR domain-containing protein [Thermodesulfobacteriota bacterium]
MQKKKNLHPFHAFLLPHLLLFALLPIALPSDIARAATTAAATVVALRGEVTAAGPSGESRQLAIKSLLYQDDTIRTGASGRVQLLFGDNTIYSLGRNSELTISQFTWQPEKQEGALKTTVKEGVFRVMGGAITRTSPRNFSTDTPAATIGIRGSMYAGTVSPAGLSLVFQGGTGIEVTNPFGAVVISQPGYGTRVSLNSRPEPPARLSEQEVAALNRELSSTDEDAAAPAPESEEAAPIEEDSVPEAEPTEESTALPAPASSTDIGADLPPANETAPVIDTTEPPPSPELPSPPVDGIASYRGSLSGSAVDVTGAIDPIDDLFQLEINWYNGKVLGRIKGSDKSPPLLFIGDQQSDTLVNISLLGSDGPAGLPLPPDDPARTAPITAVVGSGAGSFSGDSYEKLSFTAAGETLQIEPPDQPRWSSWSATGQGVMEPPEDDMDDATAPRGVEAWTGYVVGVAENMEIIDEERRLFMNDNPSDFTLITNRDQGTVSGSLSVRDIAASDAALTDIAIGGNYQSAFVLEDNFAAFAGCPSGDCVASNGASGGLKEHGNYLFSAGPDHDLAGSDYLSWGYWELAYEDPANGGQYHAHLPGTMWVAGRPTPESQVTTLAFKAEYHGQALASRIDSSVVDGPQVATLSGPVDLFVDFANLSAANAVQGTIDLGEVVLDVMSGAAGNATARGFTGAITTPGVATGAVHGSFYGPDARTIGGNFRAQFSSGPTYLGVYGASRP